MVKAFVATCALPAALAGTPAFRGWMSWEKFTCEIDCDHFPDHCIGERLFMTMADAMFEDGFVAAGYNSVQIDDCWLASTRNENGDLQADPKRFPNGIKHVADYVHSKGMKLGLYTDVGSATCCGFPSLNISAVPDVKQDAQLQRDVELMTSWGIDSLKVDGCNADAHTMNVTYPKLGQALKTAAAKYGRPAPWYSCSWPDYVKGALCGGSMKEPCVPLHDIAANCNSARLFDDISDDWHAIKGIINFWGSNPQLADLRNSLAPGTVYYNDPDMLMIGNNGLSRTEMEAQMGMWVMFAAPLIMSTEIRNGSMSPFAKATLLNKEVLAVADDELSRQATQCTDGCSHAGVLYGGATSVWNKTLVDGSVAVALLNTGNFGYYGQSYGDYNISFTAKAVGLDCGAAPPPAKSWVHAENAYLEPVPSDNILCDGSLSVDELKAQCEANSDCASFSAFPGKGGCLKRCSADSKWVNGTGNDGWILEGSCYIDDTKFEVRDLFRGNDLGIFKGTFWQEVDESSLMLLRLHCANKEVPLISV